MSGTYLRPRWAGVPSRLQLPRAGVNGQTAAAFTLLETADMQNLKIGAEARVPSLLLQASDGSTWRMTLVISAPGQAQPVVRFTLVEPP